MREPKSEPTRQGGTDGSDAREPVRNRPGLADRLASRFPRVVPFVRWMGSHFAEKRTTGLAAETTFWVFLSLLPIAAVAGLVGARLALRGQALPAAFETSLPPAMRELVERELMNVAAWNGGAVALPAAAVFVWLASSGVQAVFDAFEVTVESSRPWWKKRLYAIGTCVALSFGTVVIALLGTGLEWFWAFSDAAFPPGWVAELEASVVARAIRLMLGAAVAVAMVSGLYWVGLPRERRQSLPIVPGALLTVVLQIALGLGYATYIGVAGDGGAYQAGLATIGITLMTIYLFVIALLVGLQFNQYLCTRRAARSDRASARAAAPGETVSRPAGDRIAAARTGS